MMLLKSHLDTIPLARKKELIKTLIVCGVNSVKYNWEKEIQIQCKR